MTIRPISYKISYGNRVARVIWGIAWLLFYRFTPRPFHPWRRFMLRLFGATVGAGAHPYPSARIWAPWNLELGKDACLADGVDCYSVAKIVVADRAVVSQYSYLCAASHNYRDVSFPLVVAPILISEDVWIAADVFVGPGVTVGQGAVVGARSSVFEDVSPWVVARGNPAVPYKSRVLGFVES